ncbi:MAG TPA: nuclear transport factor 2 family protein [Pyrinomonadaceae bacterium]|nr:nuclear transport factor 2 family protein [Pyrinomonadaceae bacterium]
MNEKGQNTSVNRSEKTSAIDREKTVATPHFDAAAVEKARPAVPLSQVRQGRNWPTSLLIIIAILSGLAGGIIGGLLPMLYQTEDARQTVAAQQTPVEDAVPGQSPAQTVTNQPVPAKESSSPDEWEAGAKEDTEATLRNALKSWVAATNARDLERQMNFYNPVVEAFYQSRNAPRALVRADKARVYRRANSIDISTGDTDIEMSPDGRTAVMRFRKRYAIEGGGEDRRGEVLQELRWQMTGGQWRITSERDLQVVR